MNLLPNKCTIFQVQTQAAYGLFKDVHRCQGGLVLTRQAMRAEALPDSVEAQLGLDAFPFPPASQPCRPATT